MTILTVGSRGDVQPMLGLGGELERRGHEIRVATHPKYEPLVRGAGLGFAPVAEGRLSRGLQTPEGRRWASFGGRLPAWLGYLLDARSVARRRLRDVLEACADAEVIIAGDLTLLLGWQMSEHYGQPLIRVRLSPPVAPRPPRAGARRALWLVARPWLDRIRHDVGLPSLPDRDPITRLTEMGSLTLGAFSPELVTGPRSGCVATGYWFLSPGPDPAPPGELIEFLQAGPSPVCIGFGSMLDTEPERTMELVVDALGRAGRRGVLIRGDHGLRGTDLPPTVFALPTVSHEQLFGHCAAIVHHASAGTTAAALRAGVPSVPIPHMGDQPRWGDRIHELGVATAPIPRRRLTAAGLHRAIAEATSNPAMRREAASLGRRIRSENGSARAAELIDRRLDRAHQHRVSTDGVVNEAGRTRR